MLFEDNIDPSLSIDETALSNGELYTIVTNKKAKGGKKAIVAMLKGTQAEQIMAVLERIPARKRNKVREVTMDMAANMIKAIRDAVQEARIKYRWEALEAESQAIEIAKRINKATNLKCFQMAIH